MRKLSIIELLTLRASVLATVTLVLMILGTTVALAQDYPNKPIRIITAAAGGGSDFTSRQIAGAISGPLGQPVIVENRGSGIILGEFLSKAPPDGYGLVVTGSSFWLAPILQKMPYDAVQDFSPISLLTMEVNLVVSHPSLPVKSIKELITMAKSRPGELNFSSAVLGSSSHFAEALFNSMTGVKIVIVPYKGTAASITAVLSGEVQLTINDAGFVAPFVSAGRLRALAVTTVQPSALAPGLPTVASSGLSGYEAVSLAGIFAPGKTPQAIITRINQEIVRFLSKPEVKERFIKNGVEVIVSSPDQQLSAMKAEIAKMSKIVKDAGIKVD